MTSINSLHGMEIEMPKKLPPITLPQIYYHLRHLEDFLLPEIVQHIFSLLPGIETINDDLPQIDKVSTMLLSYAIQYSIENNGHCLTVERLKRNLLRRKISICDVKNVYAETALYHSRYANVNRIFLEVAGHEVWRLLTSQTKERKQTALHCMVQNYCIQGVKLLLDAAGDKAQDLMDIPDHEGKTAFDIASREAKELMLQYQKKSQ